jgi:hypothetical protein
MNIKNRKAVVPYYQVTATLHDLLPIIDITKDSGALVVP